MRYEGTLYRPPSEARSLIVQVTIGCAYNRCRFCTMYKDKKFRIRDMEAVKKDFYEARDRYGDRINKIFLADGDALVLPPDKLAGLLSFIKGLFLQAASITAYGSPKDILRHTPGDLKMLQSEGLSMIYMGAESGDDRVLLDIDKGVTSEEIISAGLKLKEAGIKSSITLISGLGGSERLTEHAISSAELVSRIKPDYVGFLTLMLEEGAPIIQDISEGRLTLLKPEEVVTEMELFLSRVDSEGTVFRANHASNYMMLKGTLNSDIPDMLSLIENIKREGVYRSESRRHL